MEFLPGDDTLPLGDDTLPPGDYTRLAGDYARHRAGYSPGVAAQLAALADLGVGRALDAADVGAGTGLWTAELAAAGCRTTAVEPNAAMRERGVAHTAGSGVRWLAGSAEATGLADGSCDLVTMASAFHWADFDRAVAEFERVLRPRGVFAALWNTRDLAPGSVAAEVEAELERRVPHLERRASGRSAFCESLTERLAACGRFEEVLYLEDRHVERLEPERYLGLWRSVNDARAQAGERAFGEFLDWVAARVRGLDEVEATYRTRVWAARVP